VGRRLPRGRRLHPDGKDVTTPWIALAAIALATERIRLGPDRPAGVGGRHPRRRAPQRADAGAGFDIAVGDREPAADREADRAYVGALAQAGATWWQEWLAPGTPLDDVRAHIDRGPFAI
jgi:hypothetical protein